MRILGGFSAHPRARLRAAGGLGSHHGYTTPDGHPDSQRQGPAVLAVVLSAFTDVSLTLSKSGKVGCYFRAVVQARGGGGATAQVDRFGGHPTPSTGLSPNCTIAYDHHGAVGVCDHGFGDATN